MGDAHASGRLSGLRVGLIAALCLLAILAFFVLWDVRLNDGDWWFDGLSDALSRSGMTALLLSIEGVALLAILLLLVIPGPAPAYPEPWVSTGGARVGGDPSRLQIGCPGCGTVFEKPYMDVDEPHEQTFRCPNCGRQGHLNLALHKPVEVKPTVCASCGAEFKSYRKTAECPHCHTPQ